MTHSERERERVAIVNLSCCSTAGVGVVCVFIYSLMYRLKTNDDAFGYTYCYHYQVIYSTYSRDDLFKISGGAQYAGVYEHRTALQNNAMFSMLHATFNVRCVSFHCFVILVFLF